MLILWPQWVLQLSYYLITHIVEWSMSFYFAKTEINTDEVLLTTMVQFIQWPIEPTYQMTICETLALTIWTDIPLLQLGTPVCGDVPAFVGQVVVCNYCNDLPYFCFIVWKDVCRISLRYALVIYLLVRLHNKVFCSFKSWIFTESLHR